MIFVVCGYERHARYWFNEFASRSPEKHIDIRKQTVKVGKHTVRFIGEHTYENSKKLLKDDDSVVFWINESKCTDMEELEYLINTKMLED